jgi:hypothetical protein
MPRDPNSSDPSGAKDGRIPVGTDRDDETVLQGTTLKVYRYLFKQGKPVRIHDIQKGLGLSSPSVAQYQVAKLLRAGLIRETAEGYVVDRVILGNLVRVRRMVLPYQIAYTVFFAAALVVLVSVLKPAGPPTSAYAFSVIVVFIGLAISLFESVKEVEGI